MEKSVAYKEGFKAFHEGVSEINCPYSMETRWQSWCDWTCGHADAMEEKYGTDEFSSRGKWKFGGNVTR